MFFTLIEGFHCTNVEPKTITAIERTTRVPLGLTTCIVRIVSRVAVIDSCLHDNGTKDNPETVGAVRTHRPISAISRNEVLSRVDAYLPRYINAIPKKARVKTM